MLEITERLALLENIIALMPGHVYWVDKNNVYLGCNNNQATSSGLQSRKDIIGKCNKDLPWNFNSGILPDQIDQINREVMETGKEVLLQEPATLQDGSSAIFLSNKSPLYNGKGEIIGVVGISVDITEQKRTEQELSNTHHKLQGMTVVSASIAHELRTRLTSMKFAVSNLRSDFEDFQQLYVSQENSESKQDSISKIIESIHETFEEMDREVNLSNLVIDLLLENVKPEQKNNTKEKFSIVNCVNEALGRYPFTNSQKTLIQWKPSCNFLVEGKELSLIHVLFNLIKNALYFVNKAGKGEISISIEQGIPYNLLLFKDTGTGILAEDLTYIFDRFFSKTEHGAGIGLAWCKMVIESLGGEIHCESEEGEFTLFKIALPNVGLIAEPSKKGTS